MAQRPSEPLRQEHQRFQRRLTELHTLAERLRGDKDRVENMELQRVFDWLVSELLPHAADEEEGLYPLVDRLTLEGGRASATMLIDHLVIREKVHDFGKAVAGLVGGVGGWRRIELLDRARILAYQLEAILALHMKKEEEVYFELIDSSAASNR